MAAKDMSYIPAVWCPHCTARSRKTIGGFYRSAFFPNPAFTDASLWFQQQHSQYPQKNKNNAKK